MAQVLVVVNLPLLWTDLSQLQQVGRFIILLTNKIQVKLVTIWRDGPIRLQTIQRSLPLNLYLIQERLSLLVKQLRLNMV